MSSSRESRKILIESASMIRKALEAHLLAIRSLDPLPKERRQTQGIRSSLLQKIGANCCLCLANVDLKYIEAAHIVPLQLGAKTTESNLVLLCSTCHKMYDSGYMSIAAMNDIHAEWLAGTRNIPINLSKIKVPTLSAAITPPPESIRQPLENIRKVQIASKPVVAIRMAMTELKKYTKKALNTHYYR